MSYRIKRHETMRQALRRIAHEQLEKMIVQIDDREADPHDTVHDVRKRCKKLRGLLRLVRPALKGGKTYQRENRWYADAARSLSFVRDSQSIIETLDLLLDRFAQQVNPAAFADVRERLVERRQTITSEQTDIAARLQEFRRQMLAGQDRVDQWRLRESRFAAVAGGLEKTYGRGRQALKAARRRNTTEHLHEWRKRTKYHWYHCRLLREAWPGAMRARADLAQQLSDRLGDDHDLSILAETLTAEGEPFGEPATLEALLGLVHGLRQELQGKAQLEGRRLYAEKSSALVTRLEAYWKARQRPGKCKPGKLIRHELKVVAG